MDYRKIMYIAISIVCVVSIIAGVYIQFDLQTTSSRENKNSKQEQTAEKTQEELKKEFNQTFNNTINTGNYDTSNIKKLDASKEIVYTAYENETSKDGKYELEVSIPAINIDNQVVSEFNNTTQQLFANKTTEILEKAEQFTVYSIAYTGYINENILSVVIKSTLKEGSNAQRTIIETYNYNLETGEAVSIYDALNQVGKTTNDLTSKINTEITKAITEANKIQLTGYETFTRDINSDIYHLENITTFYIGENGKLYVIFAYGNNNFTSEMDIIEM